MEKFWDLLERSIIVQSLVTLASVSAVIYLAIIGQPVPQILTDVTMAIVGFWFGSKTTHEVQVMASRLGIDQKDKRS